MSPLATDSSMNPCPSKGAQFKGISKQTLVHSYHGQHRQANILSAGKQEMRRHLNLEKRAASIAGQFLTNNLFTILIFPNFRLEMDRDNGAEWENEEVYTAAFFSIPPGNKGFGLSHEGGEAQCF